MNNQTVGERICLLRSKEYMSHRCFAENSGKKRRLAAPTTNPQKKKQTNNYRHSLPSRKNLCNPERNIKQKNHSRKIRRPTGYREIRQARYKAIQRIFIHRQVIYPLKA